MLKAMINRIVELAAPTTYQIGEETYSIEKLYRIDPKKDMPKSIAVTGLDSVCKLVRNEAKAVGRQLFKQNKDYRHVCVFSTYDNEYERCYLYECTADTPQVTMGNFMAYERAIIELRSLYIPNDDMNYLLSLLGSISKESKVTSADNGVSQTVEARTGIALNQMVEIKPRVKLQPFRTFIEVAQPESEFLLRLNDDGCIGLYPADGGVWKLEASRNVAGYFEKELADLISDGSVVVIR